MGATAEFQISEPPTERSRSQICETSVLGLASRGFRLFPVEAQGKQPLIKEWPVKATLDPETLSAWTKLYPGCNWGLVTGHASGVFVLDIDGEEGAAAINELSRSHGGDWTNTLTAKTGRGEHLYFLWPAGAPIRNSASKLALGLDVRGEGGYVVVPPSIHECGQLYIWVDEHTPIADAPTWLREKLTSSPSPSSSEAEHRDGIPEGQRNQTLTSLAGSMRRRGMTEYEIELALLAVNTNRCVPTLPEEEVRRIARSVSHYEPAVSPTLCVYGGGRFEQAETGIIYTKDEGERTGKTPLWLCAPLKVIAQTRDSKSGEWGRLLEWKDADGIMHRWAMPIELLQGDGVDVRRELARQGLAISPNRHARELVSSFLQVWPVEGRARCVERLGWHDGAYVTPAETIGEVTEHVVFQNAHALEPAISTAGTAVGWRKKVAALAVGNSRLVFSVCVAFAGPLVEPAGQDSGGFHLRGSSSSGKTKTLMVAASVWGNPSSYCRLWRATSNGLEGLAALHNDGLLILDELGQADPKEAGENAYLLANGRGKARAVRNGTARQSAAWRLLFLSAGEESLSALMARAGKRPSAGQEIRLAEIDADAGSGMGAFEELNGCGTPAELARTLGDEACRSYGVVGMDYLRHLVAHRFGLADFIADGVRQFMEEEAVPKNASGQVIRVARRFALVAVAGELATHYGLTGWKEGEANQAALKCFGSWLESFGGTGNREERALLAHIRDFFGQHGASRFQDITESTGQRVINRAGFFRAGAEGHREYLVLAETFSRELCCGFDTKIATRTLLKNEWLIPGNDGKSTQKPRLPGIGPTRVYVFGGKMWESE